MGLGICVFTRFLYDAPHHCAEEQRLSNVFRAMPGAVSIGFHSMMDDVSTHQANRVCDLNHRSTYCVVNKAMSLANPYRFVILTFSLAIRRA